MDAGLSRYNTLSRVLRSNLQNHLQSSQIWLVPSTWPKVAKRTRTKNRILDTILKSEQYFKESSLKNSIIHCNWLSFEILTCLSCSFGVEFYPLYRNLEEAFQSRYTRLFRIDATIPNRHICSVGTGAIIPTKHIRSSNIHPFDRKWVVPEQTHPFVWNGCNHSE